MNIRITFLATALLAAAISPDATAEPAPEAPPTQVVSFAELNLNSPTGVATLYRRIQKAADKVCAFPPPGRQLSRVEERNACNARATERAVVLVGVPALTAMHRAKSGRDFRSPQVATIK